MTEDNKDQYGRKDEKLKIYRIPLNFKIDASVLGFTIEWKRLFESLAVGAICFLTALMIGGMFSLDAKVMLGIEALGFIGGTAASMVGINGVSLLDYLLRIFHFMKERKVYGPPDEAYRERYELELDKERVKNQKNVNTKFDDANSKSSKKKRGGKKEKVDKKALKMEKKRKAYEKKIKEQMIRQGEDPVKVASLYIEFPKNDKNKEKQQPDSSEKKDYPIYRLGRNIKKSIQTQMSRYLGSSKNIRDQKIIDGYEIPTPFTTAVDMIPIKSISNGVIITKNNDFVKIIEINPVRYDLKTNREKNKIIENFAKYLKVAPKSMQIKSISVNADLSGIIKDSEEIISMEDNEKCRVLQQDEIEYLKQVKSHSVTRRYYIIYKVENVANTVDESIKAINVLNGYYMTAQHYLSNCGLSINEYSKNHSENMLYNLYTMLHKNSPVSCYDYKMQTSARYLQGISEPKVLRNVPIADFFSPVTVNVSKHKYVKLDDTYKAYFYLSGEEGYRESVYGDWITNLTNYDDTIDVDIFVRRENKGIVKQQLGFALRNNKSSIEHLKDTDVSYDKRVGRLMSTYYIKQQLDGEDFYYMSILVTLSAKSEEALMLKIKAFKDEMKSKEMQVYGCEFIEDTAFLNTLPLNTLDPKWIEPNAKRNVLTMGLSACFPFFSNEISDAKGIYIGLNKEDGSTILLDLFNRSLYNNANVCVLGGSGSGKTYLIQLIAMRYRKKRMPTYVIAPLKGFEWKRACLELGGTFIELSETSSSHINIMDVRVRDTSADAMIDSVTENKSAMLAKISVLKTFFSLLTSNLSPAEQDDLEGELDIALTKVYRKYGITEDNDSLFDENGNYKEMPILGDVYEECQKDDYECMSPLLKQLKKFVYGTYKGFNNRTNVNLDNLYIVFDVSTIGAKNLLPIVMFIATDFVWSKVKEDRTQDKIVLLDEVWKLINTNDTVAEYVLELYKTIRGYGGGVVCATQDLTDFTALKNGMYGNRILSNSSAKIIMKIQSESLNEIRRVFSLTEDEFDSILAMKKGQGILISNQDNVMINVMASEKEDRLITTDASKLRGYYGDSKQIEREQQRRIAG